MKRMTRGLVVASGLMVAGMGPGPVGAQLPSVRGADCSVEEAKGDLGITGLDCRGDCTLTMNERGEEQSWSFTVEPRITGVTSGGPADGVLRAGDVLVAVDGILITTSAGGRRFANLEPGENVAIRFRRGGRLAEATIHAGSACPELPPPPRPAPRVGVVGRLTPPPPEPDAPAVAGVAVGVAPRVSLARGVALAEPALGLATTGGLLFGRMPTGALGIGFLCHECGTQTDEETGENIWFFSGPIEITAVHAGGPAEEAGLQIGDIIKALDGHEIVTEEGGRAFSRITPGEATRLTVVKRNGSEVDLMVVPEEPNRPMAVGLAMPVPDAEPVRRVAGVVSVAPPASPEPLDVPVSVVTKVAPDGFPLRFSGTVEGVEVEVRGDPVMVSEIEGARVILIRSEGLWIRVRVPARGGKPEAEVIIR